MRARANEHDKRLRLTEDFSMKLNSLMLENNINTYQLSRELDVSEKSIREWRCNTGAQKAKKERGEPVFISIQNKNLQRLADYFEIPAEVLQVPELSLEDGKKLLSVAEEMKERNFEIDKGIFKSIEFSEVLDELNWALSVYEKKPIRDGTLKIEQYCLSKHNAPEQYVVGRNELQTMFREADRVRKEFIKRFIEDNIAIEDNKV